MNKWFKNKKTQAYMTLLLAAVVLLLLNVLVNTFDAHLDLTEEKRFTLTEPTKRQLRDLKDPVYVRVLLEGKFPAGFKRLQTATKDMLNDFHGINPNVSYKFEDPTEGGTPEERKRRFEQYAKDGLVPTRLRLADDKERTEKYIFPFAEINYQGQKAVVKILEEDVRGQNAEIALNNSVSLLEYKFSNAIQKLLLRNKPNIVFTEGHDELKAEETGDLEKTLRAFFNTGRINLDSVVEIPFRDSFKRVDILVIAKPKTAFSEKHKFQIDQYVMQGGKVMWLIDRLTADISGMQQTGEMTPTDYPLNLEDILFKYGVRINPNMIVDLESSRIPLKVGIGAGGEPQMDKFLWYFFPIVAPSTKHPIAKGLDRVWLHFPSSIDTIRTKSDIRKTILLSSSKRSRLQFAPTKVSFEMLRYPVDPTKFDKGNQPIAVMLEGRFPSNFENRVTAEQQAMMQRLGMQYTPLSKETKMLVVADGDIARNEYDVAKGAMFPLGFDRVDGYKFANKDFLLNAIEYMLDDKGIIEARSKEVKLRMIDTVFAKENMTTIRLINIALPLIFLAGFGFLYFWRRKKKFSA